MTDKVSIQLIDSGVPGLDELLGGGLPQYSFNLIAGEPGSGKTTLAHQIMFAQAAPERKALFFTVLGEPPLKMLRYQQQFTFFDLAKVNESVRFVNLADEVLEGDFNRVLARIIAEVEAFSPAFVFVDSFRSVIEAGHRAESAPNLQEFVQRLGMHLTSWQATTFLVGEYQSSELESNPILTVADGLIVLTQNVRHNSMVRRIQIVKLRGRAQIPGLHSFRIDGTGLRIFPRAILEPTFPTTLTSERRIGIGVPGLDKMLGGGLPAGFSLLVAGPSGSGKTILATAFLAEGARAGEPGIIATFEKKPRGSSGGTLESLRKAGKIGVIDTQGIDLSSDETLYELTVMVEKMGAKRVVIDSLSGLELRLSPLFREDFREAMYRMVAVLTGMGVTVMVTTELEDRYNDLRFSPYGAAFLTDAIIVQRYIEVDSRLKRVMAVVKVRTSNHSSELREFSIDDTGIVLGAPLVEYEGLLGGRPTLSREPPPSR